MLGKKQSEAVAVSLAEVKDILAKRSGEADFGYEQQACLDYANKMCKLSLADAKALGAELAQFEELKADTIAKITDILPPYISTLKLILAKDKITIDDSKVDKILGIIGSYKMKEIAPPPPAIADSEKKEEKDSGKKAEGKEKEEEGKEEKEAGEGKEEKEAGEGEKPSKPKKGKKKAGEGKASD